MNDAKTPDSGQAQAPAARPTTGSASGGPTAPTSKPKPPLSVRLARALLIFTAFVIALVAFYTWATLSFTYSMGERVGYARKLSHRGWICKTWEGEIAMSNLPGAQESVFAFTVREEAVVEQFRALEGKHVVVLYRERKGVPSTCFGDTPYHVYGVREVK